jgi:hypothetical protein
MARPCHPGLASGSVVLTFSLLLLSVASCGTGTRASSNPDWEAVRDTIDGTVVVRTVRGSVWGDTATLVAEVSIGVLDGAEEYMFAGIRAVTPGPDGTIYVSDPQVPALRSYNPDGTHRATFGREGSGPGEYRRPDGGLAVLSDGRVLLRDPANGRINVYSPQGEPLDTWRIRGGMFTGQRMVTDAADNAYTMILLDFEDNNPEFRSGLLQIHPDGTEGDTLEAPDSGFEDIEVMATFEGSVMVDWVPFTPREHSTLSPLGYFVQGVSTEYAFTLHRRSEPPLRIERDQQPVPVLTAESSEAQARITRDMRTTDPTWRWNGPSIPRTKPPYHGIYAGEHGRIWVLLHQEGYEVDDPVFDPTDPESVPDRWREPILFDVFESDGRYLGPVRAPAGLAQRPAPFFSGDRVWGVVRDEFDVQTVVRFKVEHPAGASSNDQE